MPPLIVAICLSCDFLAPPPQKNGLFSVGNFGITPVHTCSELDGCSVCGLTPASDAKSEVDHKTVGPKRVLNMGESSISLRNVPIWWGCHVFWWLSLLVIPILGCVTRCPEERSGSRRRFGGFAAARGIFSLASPANQARPSTATSAVAFDAGHI